MRERGDDARGRASLVVKVARDKNPAYRTGFLGGNVPHVAEDLADGVAPGSSLP